MWIALRRKDGGIVTNLPYGYQLKDGEIIVNDEQAQVVRKVFSFYLEGRGLKESGKLAGLTIHHGGVDKLLKNIKYLGESVYPQIIDKETFEKVQEERLRRAEILGRTNKIRPISELEPLTQFKIGKIRKFLNDPFKQAEYVYSLIESEVEENES